VITAAENSLGGQQVGRSPADPKLEKDVSPAALQPGFAAVTAADPSARRIPRPVIDAVGFDLRPDPLGAETPAGLVATLRDYRIWAGRPSFRELARRTDGYPAASTICIMLRSEELPAFGCMIAYLTACGAAEEDLRRFATAWRRLSLDCQAEGTADHQITGRRGSVVHRSEHQGQR
jgi:hypothetical protein